MTIPAKDLSSGLVPQRTPTPVVELDSTDAGMGAWRYKLLV
jgi:hypothetical protein